MKHKLLSLILSSLLISSCDCGGCKVTYYPCDKWHTIKNNDYYGRVNLSTYFEDDYLVLGIILAKGNSLYVDKKIVSTDDKTVDFDLIEFIDANGSKLVFNEYNFCKVTTSTTIKINYEKLDEDFKYNEIEGGKNHHEIGFYVCSLLMFSHEPYDDDQKVAYQEDILSIVGF